MAVVALIWAQAHDAAGRPVIGAAGAIPWHLPEDFTHFKVLTSGHPIIMGRKTWDSLPKKPLPNRTNIVLSRSELPVAGGLTAPTLGQALAIAQTAPGGDEVWVIGGSSIYQQAMELADRIVVTEIDLEVEGDTFAPEIPADRFEHYAGGWFPAANGLRYRFVEYARR